MKVAGALSHVIAIVSTCAPLLLAEDLRPEATVKAGLEAKAGDQFHHESCAKLPMHRNSMTVQEAQSKGLAADPECQDRISAVTEHNTSHRLAYVVTAATPVRAKPEAGAAVIHQLARHDLAPIVEGVTHGWLRLRTKDFDGYVQVGADVEQRMVKGLDLVARRVAVRKNPTWPAARQDEILMGRVRPGFSRDQVSAAKATISNLAGKPHATKTSETTKGVTERWVYAGEAITFVDGVVVEIERTTVE